MRSYACVTAHCGQPVHLSHAEVEALGGDVRCEDCRPTVVVERTLNRGLMSLREIVAAPAPPPEPPPKRSPISVARKKHNNHNPRCVECGHLNARLHYMLLPKNMRELRKRLCTPCAKKGGWTPVDYSRAPIMAKRNEAA